MAHDSAVFRLDKVDKKIIAALERDSRQPNKAIARSAGISEHVAAYRIQRLFDEGVVKKIYCIINRGALFNVGYRVFLRFQNFSEEKEKELLRRAFECMYSCWVVLCRGRWDMMISMFVEDPDHFKRLYNEMVSGFEDFIQEKEIVNYLELIDFNRAYIYGGPPVEMVEYDGKFRKIGIDPLDQGILAQLSANSRMPLVEMASKFAVSPDTIRNRIKKLEEQRLILGHGVLFDLKKIGITFYNILLNLKDITGARRKALYAFAIQHPNVIFWIGTIGIYDLTLELEIEDSMLDGFVAELRNKFGGIIKNMEILTIKETFKYTYLTQK